MIQKKKKFGSGMGTIRFAILWTLAYALGWGTLITGGIVTDVFEWIPLWGLFALGGLVPGFISSVVQQGLIKRKFNISIPRWWLWSTIAWTITAATFRLLEYWPTEWIINDERFALSIIFSALFIPPALVQAWMLRKHIARAWMWPLAAIVSSSTFILPLLANTWRDEFEVVFAFSAAGLMQGAVMGLSLLWLFGMANSEKTKKEYAENEDKQARRNLHRRLENIENDIETQNVIDGDIVAWERSEMR